MAAIRAVPWIGRGMIAVLLGVAAGCGTSAVDPQAASSAPMASMREASRPAPGAPGPFAAGHTSYVIHDTSRSGARPNDDTFALTGRPIAVSVWYPVDRESISATTPPAVYPLDPLYRRVPDSTSLDWEAYGLDPAWEAVRPSRAGPFPLLVFSPGATMPNYLHTSLGARLASHGFVVAVPHHFGMQWWPWEPLMDEMAALAFDRPLDMSFLLTDLLVRNERRRDLLSRTIRPHQVAAGGWSLGGYAALVLAGARDDSVCDVFAANFPTTEDPYGRPPPEWTCAPAEPDPRIKAFVGLDASSQVLHFWELSGVRVPSLGIGETFATLSAWYPPPMESWQARQHAAISGHPNYRVDVANAIHPSFGDWCETGHLLVDKGYDAAYMGGFFGMFLPLVCGPDIIAPADLHRIVSTYMVAFLKTELADKDGFERYLAPGYAGRVEPASQLFLTEKGPIPANVDWPPDSVYFVTPPPPR